MILNRLSSRINTHCPSLNLTRLILHRIPLKLVRLSLKLVRLSLKLIRKGLKLSRLNRILNILRNKLNLLVGNRQRRKLGMSNSNLSRLRVKLSLCYILGRSTRHLLQKISRVFSSLVSRSIKNKRSKIKSILLLNFLFTNKFFFFKQKIRGLLKLMVLFYLWNFFFFLFFFFKFLFRIHKFLQSF